MEIEVMKPPLPPPPIGFFNLVDTSACTSPYISAPSSPPRITTPFFSAPTSPTRSAATTTTNNTEVSFSKVAFNWEEKPGIAKSNNDHGNVNTDTDFAFDFSGIDQFENNSLPADELFHGGKIKPLKPPPRLQYESAISSPKSPRSPKKMFKEAFSPRYKNKDFDPFETAMENTTKRMERGRERVYHDHDLSAAASSSRHKGSRSLSPFRVSDLLFDPENVQETSTKKASSSSSFSSSWYRKWKLKDLLLFRSASEGRSISKGDLNKYAVLKKSIDQEDHVDIKNTSSSFRSSNHGSVGSSSSVSSKRRSLGGVPISAHELHYTMNRAAAEEMKRKTFLPYKQGWLGCLGFTPAGNEISRGPGSINRG